MSHWKAGHKIQNGRYIFDKLLGYGGVGVTYRAQEQLSGEYVAIKTLNALIQNESDFPKHQERFIQEAFRLARCNHPHIIRVENVCQEEALWCLVMEYIPGGTLQQYAHYKSGLSEEEALKYIFQMGDALNYIHQQGFIHRDVKPGNIMLRKTDMKAVLIDFGLARDFVQDRTQTHTNSRTESYAPIEQYELRAKRGAYTDVYALAATLYYTLTLQLPFPAQFRQQGAKLIPPKEHNPEISDTINQAILLGMELIPNHRPQSIPDWLTLLYPPTSAVTPSLPSTSSPSKHSSRQTKTSRVSLIKSNVNPVNGHYSATSSEKSAVVASPALFVSSQGVDYNPLQHLLAEGNWQEADRKTGQLILQVAGREKAGWIDESHLDMMSCEDFLLIDRLWVDYSQQHFGFSVQRDIYRQLGGWDSYDAEIWRNFAETVGWRTPQGWQPYKGLIFSLNSPKGHLPMLGMQFWGFRGWIIAIARKLDGCRI